ncbi:MAG: hypothetical protein QXR45_11820 [Candidatus Bathyarchaeia archaeon]
MVEVSANRFVEVRVNFVKREVELCSQRLRIKAFKTLKKSSKQPVK